jgi:hypothetical protein
MKKNESFSSPKEVLKSLNPSYLNVEIKHIKENYEKYASKHYKIFAKILMDENISLGRKIANLKAVKEQHFLSNHKNRFWNNEANAMESFLSICEKRKTLALKIIDSQKKNLKITS